MVPYLTWQQLCCWSRPYKFAIALSIGILLSSCEPNEMYPVPVGVPNGQNLPSQSYRPAQPTKPTILPIHPILEDPEAKTEEWEDDTFANSQEEAESKCRQKAERITQTDKTLVVSLGARQVKGKLYKCKFRTEVKP
ncbi:hypothetical protein [Phormidesmis sp. 146-33]